MSVVIRWSVSLLTSANSLYCCGLNVIHQQGHSMIASHLLLCPLIVQAAETARLLGRCEYCLSLVLQCFDVVGWAAGRASGL